MSAITKNFLPLSALTAAVLATVGAAVAAEVDEVTKFSRPESEVSAGIGYVSKDNQRFGQYTGLTEDGYHALLDVSLVKRDDGTGTWVTLSGRNLGLDNRELRFEHSRQGDWGYSIDYSQVPRYDPYTVTTTLSGIGTTTQTIAGNATAQQYHLKTERDILTIGLNKEISSNLNFQVSFRNEKKDGERLWGQGGFGALPSGGWRFLTDPINQTTRQIDATLSYTTERFQLSGGYYGTAFENRNNLLTVNGPAVTGLGQIGLPPDNESHQLHLAGRYIFSNTTHGTFKLAYARSTQNEAFATTPVTGAPGSLNGRIDTTLVQAGLSSRPTPKLSLRANVRYEDRDDKTPVFLYFPSVGVSGSTSDGTNEPRDIKTTAGGIEAAYRLPNNFRLTGGLDYVQKDRNSPPVRSVSYREKTDETTLRAELRRSISETLTGALAYIHGERGGSDWLFNTLYISGATGSNQVAPLHLADRDRDMVRLTLNWMPTEPLSINVRLDQARDQYSGRGISVVDQAVRKGDAQNYTLDVAYSFSDKVQGTAWYSVNNTALESQQCRSGNGDSCTPGVAPNPDVWGSNVRNLADTFGLGLRAKLSRKLELSADLTESKVRDEFSLNSIAGAAVSPIDVINTKITSLKLSVKYALQRDSGMRVMYSYDRYRTDDWTWANWNYSPTDGGTTVLQNPNQKVNFIGVAYYYRWW